METPHPSQSLDEIYNRLLGLKSFNELTTAEALEHIGMLIDVSADLGRREGLRRALRLSDRLRRNSLDSKASALLHYFSANAWSALRTTYRSRRIWHWEDKHLEPEIVCLRRARRDPGFRSLAKRRRSQILTNLGNLFDSIGRTVEAQEHWHAALDAIPSFAMARGNRGLGLITYAQLLYDPGHQILFLEQARGDLKAAIAGNVYPTAKHHFQERYAWIKVALRARRSSSRVDLHKWPLGRSTRERVYRRWCLRQRLFLNPLNDLGAYPIGARDVLTAPSIATGFRENPYGFYSWTNRLKQEFVSARFLLFQALSASRAHYSDRDVLLYDSPDLPVYGLPIEQARLAFRMAFSLFDKIAFGLNRYLALGIADHRVSMRTLWYEKETRERGLKTTLAGRRNLALRGLFWLSKDLYENSPGFTEALEPDAQDLADIRHHLEHKHLSVVSDDKPRPYPGAEEEQSFGGVWGRGVKREELFQKTLRVLKLSRSAIIYLFLAIHHEERAKAIKASKREVTLPMVLLPLRDDAKV